MMRSINIKGTYLMNGNSDMDIGKKYASNGITAFFGRRITQTVLLGILLTIIGVANFSITHWLFIDIFAPLCTALGTTIIAASIVGFLFADEDYMKLLKEIIVSVIFNPEAYKKHEHLIDVWRKISLKLLDNVLPFSNELAVDRIEKQFFKDERDYHFEDVDCDLNFEINEPEGTVLITQTITASLVMAPNRENPVLKQFVSMQDSGILSPIDLMLNGDAIKVEDYLTQDVDNPNKSMFEYPLTDKIEEFSGRKTVKYKRVLQLNQVLVDDPYFATNITRFVKGYNIETKISTGYHLVFARFGANAGDGLKPQELGNGKLRWELGKRCDLLLPGEGYILTVSKGEK